MESFQLGISTQTPLVRTTHHLAAAPQSSGKQLLVSSLGEDGPLQLTPGGVCRMVYPSLQEWTRRGWLKHADWFSLHPGAPQEFVLQDVPVTLHHLSLPPAELAAYGRTKEKLWADIHGIPAPRFDVEDFRFYSRYNAFTSDALLEHAPELDLAYVHDFQLMQVGALIGLAAPSVLRWHVPFEPARIPAYTRTFLRRAMEDYDAVIVSTRRDLEGLLRVGYRGMARQLYPHIDLAAWPDVPPKQVQAIEDQLGLGRDDPLILCVARMDPVKRQDLAMAALASIRRQHPAAKVVFVGNGSFSGSTNGGLGIGKAATWAQTLEQRARDLRLSDRVVFAHWLPDAQLAALYARATAVVLPSDIEGFGLTVLEGWRYGRPAIVSSGCGVSELVHEGLNGHSFPSGDADGLAHCLRLVLEDADAADSVGKAGRKFVENFDAPRMAPREAEILSDAMTRFRGP